MNCENYEKKYKEALERAKAMIDDLRKGEDILAVSEIEAMFPELAESEDEKIRRELVEKISKLACGCFISEEQKQNFIAYLEKQKELPFVKDVMLGYLGLYFYDGERMHFRGNPAIEEKQKEQKPAEEDGPFNEDEFLENELSAFLQNYDKEYDDAAVSDVARHFYEIGKKQKEQKTYEPHNWPADKDNLTQEQKPVVTHGETYHVDTLGTQQVIAGKMPQKPAEWSDTDNIGWDETFACVTRAEKSAKNEEELQNAVTAEKWLKEIKFKYCVHPVKQEWSEEDERRMGGIVQWLREYQREFNPKYDSLSIESIESLITWLKSLPLRCLKPTDNWKPSEEQIYSLGTVVKGYNECAVGSVGYNLKELYNNLKTLM